MRDDDLDHLRRAIALAAEARLAGDPPFGSTLVDAAGTVIAEERNTTASDNDITAHPELKLARTCRCEALVSAGRSVVQMTHGHPVPLVGIGHVDDNSRSIPRVVPGHITTGFHLLPYGHALSIQVRPAPRYPAAMLVAICHYRLEDLQTRSGPRGQIQPALAGLGHRVHRIDDDRDASAQRGRRNLMRHGAADRPNRRASKSAADHNGLDGIDTQAGGL
jgi:hypothetical protein